MFRPVSSKWLLRRWRKIPRTARRRRCCWRNNYGKLNANAQAADFYEAEVDDMVAGISSLMEPIIIVILGTVIGGIVVAMYLPIFKLGQVV